MNKDLREALEQAAQDDAIAVLIVDEDGAVQSALGGKCHRCLMAEVGQVYTFTTNDKLGGVPAGTVFRWNIAKAINFVRTRPREPYDVAAEHIVGNCTDLVPAHIDHVDPLLPGIQLLIPGGYDPDTGRPAALCIDGTHRAARCLRDGLPFAAYMLTPEEEAQCRMLP